MELIYLCFGDNFQFDFKLHNYKCMYICYRVNGLSGRVVELFALRCLPKPLAVKRNL